MKKKYIMIILGSAVLSFGLYNIHSISDITEGGVLGLTLLLYHHFDISPAISGLILNGACYLIGLKVIGKSFIVPSVVGGLSFSIFYKLFELLPPVWRGISDYPLLASVAGAIFVGVGVGLCVACNSAPSGDDALALSINKALKINIQWVYLISDILVLLMSLTYINYIKILYSVLTVILSGQIIGFVKDYCDKNILKCCDTIDG